MTKKKNKILFFVTEDWYFLSHRIKLAEYLINKGLKVHLCCKDTGKVSLIESKGISCHTINIKRKSFSVIQYFNEVFLFIKFCREIKPKYIHLISMRPIIAGMLASFFIKSKVVATFTGMGFLFIRKGMLSSLVVSIIINFIKFCLIFKKIKIVVQNSDDKKFFLKRIVNKNTEIKIIRGSGIDLNHYVQLPEPKNKNIVITYVGRLLKDKGVLWLFDAFQEAKKKFNNIELYIAGSFDNRNPTTISKNDLNKFLKIKSVHYLGNVTDIKKLWKKSNIAILLSKREGLPLSLIEAAAMGRPIVATDVPGCREIALNNYNAITVQPGDIKATSRAIVRLCKDRRLRKTLANNGRKIVEGDMQIESVCKRYYSLYKKL